MQEEVENRTGNLAVSTAKLTGRSLVRAVRFFIMRYDRKRQQKKMLNPYAEGKQSVEELLKSGVGRDWEQLPTSRSAHLSDKCIACQFVKKPVKVRFFGNDMWIMECGRVSKGKK